MTKLRIAPDHWRFLNSVTSDETGTERMAFLLCGRYVEGGEVVLLSHSVHPLQARDYQVARRDQLAVDPIAVNEILVEAEQSGLSVVMAHTHPGSRDPHFSSADLHGESLLFPLVTNRMPDRPHGALVLGVDAGRFRAWAVGSDRPIEGGLIINDQPIRRYPTLKSRLQHTESRESLFLGGGAVDTLSDFTVAIVGLGGTGSLVNEMLAHLRIGGVVLIDHDVVEETNLTRLVGAIKQDIGRPKVEVAARLASSVNPGGDVKAVAMNLLTTEAVAQALTASFIVCCTDSHASRLVLNRIAWQYLIPVVDVGVLIRLDARTQHPEFVGGAVRVVGSGHMCLVCGDQIDPARVTYEMKSEQEHRLDSEFGYIPGFVAPEPAVITLNSVVAGLGATVLLNHIGAAIPAIEGQLIVDLFAPTLVRTAVGMRRGCDVCGEHGVVGLGDLAALPPVRGGAAGRGQA